MAHLARKLFAATLLSLLPFTAFAQNNERYIEGPIAARVIEIIDGDTIAVEIHTWLYTTVTTRVRLRGIDTAEINRALCEEEARIGLEGLDLTTRFVIGDTPEAFLIVTDITPDKYAGRVIANVANMQGDHLAEALLAAGVAKPYNGGPRPDWC